MAAILPGKFDDDDFDAWLREFDACAAANGWKVTEHTDDKILKLPAFLRGRAACNFYAIPEGERHVQRCRKIDATSPMSTSEARKFLRRV